MLRNALRPVFSLCAAFKGALILKRRANSLFPQEPYGKLGALAQKRGFACARIILMYPKFYILHSTFYIQKEILRRAFYRAPENRSAARFLGKRSGRRNGQGGKRSEPPAMAPWRDELRMTGAQAFYLPFSPLPPFVSDVPFPQGEGKGRIDTAAPAEILRAPFFLYPFYIIIMIKSNLGGCTRSAYSGGSATTLIPAPP